MKDIKTVLKGIKIEQTALKKPINPDWEAAKEFGEYVKIPTKMVLVLFKKFGKKEVLGIRGWLKDIPNARSHYGLAVYRLKQIKAEKEGNTHPKDLNPHL